MNTIRNLFIAYLCENQRGIPHDVTFNILEAIDHSTDLQRLNVEYFKACQDNPKKIKEKTIDNAAKELERISEICIDTRNISDDEKRTLKASNKISWQLAKQDYISLLQFQGFIVY